MTAAITGFSQFAQLKASAERDDPEALRAVAREFEALFLETILKNMRAGELAEPLFGESDQLSMYREMMDSELARNMAEGRGIGFSDMLVRQLGGETNPPRPASETFRLLTPPVRSAPISLEPVGHERDGHPLERARNGHGAEPADQLLPGLAPSAAATDSESPAASVWPDPQSFVRDLWPHAERVAERLDVAPEAILAQAALETGWGAHVMRRGDGLSSHNLFGIKAGPDWPGGSVGRATVEYVDGLAQRRVEQFRAYNDISETFDDYARMIEENRRYSAVPGTGSDVTGFAEALQDGGYATDPLYAAKIVRVLGSETMQSALASLKTP
jgi:peptidoglycan hydrolase FlgJ